MTADIREKIKKLRAKAADKGIPEPERESLKAKVYELEQKHKIDAAAEEEFEKLKEKYKGHTYENMVDEGRGLTATLASKGWELGDLARVVATTYGERTIEKFAKEINIPHNTLKDYMATANAWPQKVGRPTFVWVARSLNKHPDRYKLANKQPTMTKERAKELAQEWRAKKKTTSKQSMDSFVNGVRLKIINLYSNQLHADWDTLAKAKGELEPKHISQLEDAATALSKQLYNAVEELKSNVIKLRGARS